MKSVAFLFLALAVLAGPAAHAQRGGPQGPTPVIVSPVVRDAFSDSIEALGTTRANETVVVTADVTAKVIGIHFEDGQTVTQDDRLVTLDNAEEEAELRAAQASLEEAKSAYTRARNLRNNQVLSEAILEERFATKRETQAAVEAIKARLDTLVIEAPFDGVLGLRDVSVGTLVTPGDRITTLDDLSRIKVDFDVPSLYLQALRQGLPVTGTVEAYPDRTFTGTVQTVNTQVDPVTRTVRVRAILPNDDGALKPGLLMAITLNMNARQTLLVPEEALVKRSDTNMVFVVEQDGETATARQRAVTIGGRLPGVVEILDGVQEGDQIVTHGTVKVRDGAQVAIKATETEDAPLQDLLHGQQSQQDQQGENES